jgi:hypothetical protein
MAYETGPITIMREITGIGDQLHSEIPKSPNPGNFLGDDYGNYQSHCSRPAI